MLGHIRRQLIVFANSRHRPDLADVFQHAPKSDRGARVPSNARSGSCPRCRRRSPRSATASTSGCLRGPSGHCRRTVSTPLGADRAHSPPAWLVESHRGTRHDRRPAGRGFLCRTSAAHRARPGPDPDYSAQRHRAVGAVASAERSRRLAGQFRAPRNACTLNATNDYEAVQAWLALHETVATQRAYRKEAARLILWAIVERGRALSSLTTDDAIAYRAFVRHPTPRERWVGPPRPRDSVEWRPFSGGLSARSAAYALTVLSALFRWLIEQRYVLANPFAGVKVRGHALRPALDTARGFTEENGYCCAPLQTAWNGPTAGPSRQHNACASCSTSAMPRACALANWSAPSW